MKMAFLLDKAIFLPDDAGLLTWWSWSFDLMKLAFFLLKMQSRCSVSFLRRAVRSARQVGVVASRILPPSSSSGSGLKENSSYSSPRTERSSLLSLLIVYLFCFCALIVLLCYSALNFRLNPLTLRACLWFLKLYIQYICFFPLYFGKAFHIFF